jgi:hypothetical protein
MNRKRIQVGDDVDVPEPGPSDLWSHAFAGRVVRLRDGGQIATVVDGDDDAWDVEVHRLQPCNRPTTDETTIVRFYAVVEVADYDGDAHEAATWFQGALARDSGSAVDVTVYGRLGDLVADESGPAVPPCPECRMGRAVFAGKMDEEGVWSQVTGRCQDCGHSWEVGCYSGTLPIWRVAITDALGWEVHKTSLRDQLTDAAYADCSWLQEQLHAIEAAGGDYWSDRWLVVRTQPPDFIVYLAAGGQSEDPRCPLDAPMT